MNKLVTTYSCDKCHEVRFLVLEEKEAIKFICQNCNEVKVAIKPIEYKRLKKQCDCADRVFKLMKSGNLEKLTIKAIKCGNCNDEVEWLTVDEKGNEITEEEREDLLNTVKCEQCGSGFLVMDNKHRIPKVKCAECGIDVEEIRCEDYVSLKDMCSCENNIFKMLKNEKLPTCTKCGNTAEKIYIDDDGNEIDRATRELLIIQDNYNYLERQVDEMKTDIEERIYNVEWNLSNIRSKIEDINEDKYTIQNYIRSIEGYINRLKKDVGEIEFQVEELKYRD